MSQKNRNITESTLEQSGLSEAEDAVQPRSHDLFEDPAIKRSIKEDPVARLLASNWKTVLTLIVLALVAFYLKTQIQETSLARIKESSQVFDQASKALQTLTEDNNSAAGSKLSSEEKDKLTRSLKDSLANLQSGSMPYSDLSTLFASIATTSGVLPSTGNSVSAADWKSEKDESRRLVKELEALVQARKKLDDNQVFAAGVGELKDLSKEAQYLDLSAFFILTKVVESDEDKKTVRELGASVSERHPEQASKIETELKRL